MERKAKRNRGETLGPVPQDADDLDAFGLTGFADAADADIYDVNPAFENVDRAREFSPADNPFLDEARWDAFPALPAIPAAAVIARERRRGWPAQGRSLAAGKKANLPREWTEGGKAALALSREGREGGGPTPPKTGLLDALFLDIPFPARKAVLLAHLGHEARLQEEGPAGEVRTWVGRLEAEGFEDLPALKAALRERILRGT